MLEVRMKSNLFLTPFLLLVVFALSLWQATPAASRFFVAPPDEVVLLQASQSMPSSTASRSANYQLCRRTMNSGGSANADSTNYQLVASIGAPSLTPNGGSASTNYLLHSGFLGGFTPGNCFGPPPATEQLFLPLAASIAWACFEGPEEMEDNDSAATANGPLCRAQNYTGVPDDNRDYFYITTGISGPIAVNLTNHTGEGVQLQLFYQSTGNLVGFDSEPPFNVNHNGAAGVYYIYIYTNGGFNTTPYTLNVTSP
jgi:hypothetical protein